MKKLFLMAAFVVASVAASAQVYVGGGIGFNSYKPGYEGAESQTSFSILPEVGYKLDDKMAVGIQLGYLSTENENDLDALGADRASKVEGFTIMPYLRYTFVKWDRVSLFADLGFGYTHSKATLDLGEDDGLDIEASSKVNSWQLGITPGLSIALNDKINFITKVGWLGYKSSKLDADGAKASSDFGLNLDGANLQFAVFYNF